MPLRRLLTHRGTLSRPSSSCRRGGESTAWGSARAPAAGVHGAADEQAGERRHAGMCWHAVVLCFKLLACTTASLHLQAAASMRDSLFAPAAPMTYVPLPATSPDPPARASGSGTTPAPGCRRSRRTCAAQPRSRAAPTSCSRAACMGDDGQGRRSRRVGGRAGGCSCDSNQQRRRRRQTAMPCTLRASCRRDAARSAEAAARTTLRHAARTVMIGSELERYGALRSSTLRSCSASNTSLNWP